MISKLTKPNIKSVTKTKTNETTRSNCEHNCTELICALIICFQNINNTNDIINTIAEMKKTPEYYESKIKFNKPTDLTNYENDIYKKINLDNYILNFKKSIKDNEKLQGDNINCIFISGKNNNHDEIKILNEGVDKLQAKSDIYVKLNNGEEIAISVKQDPEATKSNYSVHVILQALLGKDHTDTLNNIKIKYLNENGITGKMDDNLSEIEKKKYRDMVNPLFYKENDYFIKLRELIFNKKVEISIKLVESLYCSKVKYDVYEFDGFNFIKLNQVFDQSDITFEEHLPYYFMKSGKKRNVAKLFYRLVVKEKVYRVEIRWKGEIYGASPQFQIHSDFGADENKIKKEKVKKVNEKKIKEVKKKYQLIIEDDEEEVINEVNEVKKKYQLIIEDDEEIINETNEIINETNEINL
jgi:hypothetical protein